MQNTGRDLSIGKHPVLIGRMWPNAIQHWKEMELDQFLEAHRYPPHTWRDHQEARRQSAIKSLVAGLAVPSEVLEEDASIAADAQMHLADSAAASMRLEREKKESQRLEIALGAWSDEGTYTQRIRLLLRDTLKQRNGHGKSRMAVNHSGWNLQIRLDEGRPARWGYFGTVDGGRQKRLLVVSDTGGCAYVDWPRAEAAITKLLTEGLVTFDDVWFLTGTGWQPKRAVVEVLRSPQ